MKNYSLDLPVIVNGLIDSISGDSAIVDVEGTHHQVPTKVYQAVSGRLNAGDEVQVLIAPVSGLILSLSIAS